MSTATIQPQTTMPRTGNAWQFRVLIVAVYSLSLGIIGSALRIAYGFPLDDSYIHQTIARNLAQNGVLGPGSTSTVWPFLQAVNYKLIHLDPVIFNLILSWLLLAGIGWMLFSFARRDGFPMSHCLAFAITPALSGNFLWLGLIGMEHLLFVAVVLACIYFWSEERVLLAAAAAGLLILIRPEALIFAFLSLVAWRKWRRLAIWIVFLAALFSFNFYTSHSVMPETLKGRNWLYFNAIGGPHSGRALASFALLWLNRIEFSILQPSHFAVLWILVPLALIIAGAVWLMRRGGTCIRLLFSFAAAHCLIYLLLFPSPGHGGRYQPLNLLLLFPCVFFGLVYFFGRVVKPQTATAAAFIVVLAAGAMSLRTWRTVTVDGIAHIDNTHARAAEWLVRNAQPNARVAVFDIGRIGYDWNHPLLDLGGLTDPSYIPYLLSRNAPAYVRERQANYLILPSGKIAAELGFTQMSAFTEVARFCSPSAIWQPGWYLTGHAEQCQTIYRMP